MKPKYLLLLLFITSQISAYLPHQQLAVAFYPSEITVPQQVQRIKNTLNSQNPNLNKPLVLNYVHYYGDKYDIIITPNQAIDLNNAANTLENKPYIARIKVVSGITIN